MRTCWSYIFSIFSTQFLAVITLRVLGVNIGSTDLAAFIEILGCTVGGLTTNAEVFMFKLVCG